MNSELRRHSQYSTFNARWLSPEQVARTFVPISQFRQLVHNSSSILFGPRGCGKTTLLKMLTRRALIAWNQSKRAEQFKGAFEPPIYEAIYIPSDIRWSHELSTLTRESYLSPQLAESVQRVFVTLSSLRAVVSGIADITPAPQSNETAIALKLLKRWQLSNTLPQFADVRHSLDALVASLRGFLNRGDEPRIRAMLDELPPEFYGFVLDAPIDACQIASDLLPESNRPVSWAFCYDELEIAPAWLRNDLLLALRSVPFGSNLLKLTCSPMLPSGVKSAPGSLDDYRPIRLWSSYVQDPRPFCDDLTRDFLADRFPDVKVTPETFLHRSILAEDAANEPPGAYEPESTEYIVFKEVAAWDGSFARLLKERGYEPENPVPRTTEDKDQFFRKVKGIALLRREFLLKARARSRKSVMLFAGKEAVYAMSEGNPRWLLGLLNDLADFGTSFRDFSVAGTITAKYRRQARILASASNRYLAQIKATPPRVKSDISLYDFVVRLGLSFQSEIYDRDFPLDPIGSFEVPVGVDVETVQTIEQLLELGALIHIGTSEYDVPVTVEGCRFRLSFMLAPTFRLPFRTYRPAQLADLLGGRKMPGQLELDLETSREN